MYYENKDELEKERKRIIDLSKKQIRNFVKQIIYITGFLYGEQSKYLFNGKFNIEVSTQTSYGCVRFTVNKISNRGNLLHAGAFLYGGCDKFEYGFSRHESRLLKVEDFMKLFEFMIKEFLLYDIYNINKCYFYEKCDYCKKIRICKDFNGNNFCSEECNKKFNGKELLDKKNNEYVYIIEAVDMGFYKIGRTNDVNVRLKSLVKLPFEINLIYTIETQDSVSLESELHNKYKEKRVNGEWFCLSQRDIEYIKSIS